jgi:hypothetical protein
MIRKGQVRWLPKGDLLGQIQFIREILGPLIHQFLPGPAVGFDGLDADPNGITNFRSSVAQAYFAGAATDNGGAN